MAVRRLRKTDIFALQECIEECMAEAYDIGQAFDLEELSRTCEEICEEEWGIW